jgi:hypothetical protein
MINKIKIKNKVKLIKKFPIIMLIGKNASNIKKYFSIDVIFIIKFLI